MVLTIETHQSCVITGNLPGSIGSCERSPNITRPERKDCITEGRNCLDTKAESAYEAAAGETQQL